MEFCDTKVEGSKESHFQVERVFNLDLTDPEEDDQDRPMSASTFWTLSVLLSVIILAELFMISLRYSQLMRDWWLPDVSEKYLQKLQSR